MKHQLLMFLLTISFFTHVIAQKIAGKNVRIGIYVLPNVNLHSKLITDIAHYYAEEKKGLENGMLITSKDTSIYSSQRKAQAEFRKLRHDSVDLFERLFSNVASFTSLLINGNVLTVDTIKHNDTTFIPFAKVEEHTVQEISMIMMRDTLDYFIGIQNFNSIKNGSYYDIKFTLLIQPKLKTKGLLKKKVTISYTDKQTDPNSFLHCEKPFECLIANITGDCTKIIVSKLLRDGYCKKLYEEYKEEGMLE